MFSIAYMLGEFSNLMGSVRFVGVTSDDDVAIS